MKNRQPLRIGASTLGTVRSFKSLHDFNRHLVRMKSVNRIGEKETFTHFEFMPTNVFYADPDTLTTIEQVYRGPTAEGILKYGLEAHYASRYGPVLIRRMLSKGANFAELKEAVSEAVREVETKIISRVFTDPNPGNILILDYNPESKKVLLAIIDHGFSQ